MIKLPIRIGLLGAANISDKAIFQPLKKLDGFLLQAVAASNIDKAQQYAKKHAIAFVADSYQALLERDDLDLIYNALPPSEHKHWTIQALKHGKHVLCEKPFAMNADEACSMVAVADVSGKLLLEAFHYRFHPLFIELQQLLQRQLIGAVHTVRANFSVRIPYEAGSLRHEPTLGGGAMMDLGCYPLHWVRTLMASEPEVLSAKCIEGTPHIDISTQATLRFADGCIAYIGTSMAEHLSKQHEAYIKLEGEYGEIEVFGLIAPHLNNSISITVNGQQKQYQIAGEQTYYYQLQHVKACLLGLARPLTGGQDAINNMRLLDAIYQQAGLRIRSQCL